MPTPPTSASPARQRVLQWDKLVPADAVEVYRDGTALPAGRVDMLMRSGYYFWVFPGPGARDCTVP
ncbi:hypothetical protein J2Y41_003911 [Arthrobacter sp. 1088]|nr:hypothetical protein [Arthrobacter sp. 1088]